MYWLKSLNALFTFKDTYKNVYSLLQPVMIVVPQITSGYNAISLCLYLQSLLTMWEPLRMLKDKHAFPNWFHDLIPTKKWSSQGQEAINTLKVTDTRTIQHILPIIMTLWRLTKLYNSKLVHNNKNVLNYIPVICML
jgi:hypothetical protein